MITEVFLSIQGEGLYVGQPQIFIRFAKCNLDCDFCDTKIKKGRDYDVFGLLERVESLNNSGGAETVSITGGEPLLYADFLKSALPEFKKRNFKIYLETNATLPGGLEKILDLVDIVAMDMKLPSAQKAKKAFWGRHRDFLSIAKAKDVFVKVVVTDRTTKEEIKKAVEIIDDIRPGTPLVLQPVTPAKRVRKKVPLEKILEFQRLAGTILHDVRVIPQTHKILGIR